MQAGMFGEIFVNLYQISSIDGLKRNYTNKVGFTDEHLSNSPYNLNRLITAYLNINSQKQNWFSGG